MDFLSLSSEYESYVEFINNSSMTMTCFINFYTSLQNSFNIFAKNTRESLNVLFTNLIQFDNRSTLSKKFFEFYRLFEKYLSKLDLLSEKISTQIIQPTLDIQKFFKSKTDSEMVKLSEIINSTINQKKKYEIIKHNYFDCSKAAEAQEKNLIKVMEQDKNQQNINYQNGILTKLRIEATEECQKYKNILNETNKLYDINNNKYFPIINNLKDCEEKRLYFLYSNFQKFISILSEQKNSLNFVLSNYGNEDIVKVKIEEDMLMYQEKFSYIYKPNQRFIKEDFLLYDIYRRNIETIIKSSNKLIKQNNIPIPNLDINYIGNNTKNQIRLDQNDEIVFNSIFSNNPYNINRKIFVAFENKLKTDCNFAQNVIDKMLNEIFKKVFVKRFENKSQFDKLSDILIDIAMNSKIQNDLFDLNFAIIFIAEKTYYYNKDTDSKYYLCKALSEKYENFRNKFFWKKMIDYKKKKMIEILVEKEINQMIRKNKINLNQPQKNFPIFGKNKIVISENETKKIIEKIKKLELFNIIRDFLVHFGNFNLDLPSSNDIILEISSEENLSTEQISFFVSFINSNMYNIKNNKIKKPIKKTHNNQDLIINNKILTTNNTKLRYILITLNSAFRFLEIKDYININLLNKTLYQTTQKIIYKKYFLKEDKNYEFEKHMKMYFNILHYNPDVIIYETILKEALNINLPIIDIIEVDIIRTFFDEDQDNNRKKLHNILIAIAYKYESIGYCQGMNYIAGFFLILTNDEKKTFDIMSFLISKTNYGKSFQNEFEMIKKYYYVFERLIQIYLPDLHNVLRKNNVDSSYYISPWFITLFTYNLSGNNTKIILRIIDLLIIEGWDSIIRVGLVLLKHYQDDLMKMKFEELLHFLITELKERYEFFHNNNFDKFIDLYNNMKVPKGLISNIENEYEIEKKVLKIREKDEKIQKEKENEINI